MPEISPAPAFEFWAMSSRRNFARARFDTPPVDLKGKMMALCQMSKATTYRFIGELKVKKLAVEKDGLLYLRPKAR